MEIVERQHLRHCPLTAQPQGLALARVGIVTAPVDWQQGQGSSYRVNPTCKGHMSTSPAH